MIEYLGQHSPCQTDSHAGKALNDDPAGQVKFTYPRVEPTLRSLGSPRLRTCCLRRRQDTLDSEEYTNDHSEKYCIK